MRATLQCPQRRLAAPAVSFRTQKGTLCPLAVTLQPPGPLAPGNPGLPISVGRCLLRHSCTWSHTGVLRAWPLPLACPQGSPLCCSPVLPGPQPSRPLCGPHADGHGEFSEIPSEGPAGAQGPGCRHPRWPLRAARCGLGAGALRSLWATSSALSCDLRSVTSPASLLTWKMEFKTWLRRRLRAPLWEVSCRAPGLRPTFPARLSGSAVHPPLGVRVGGWTRLCSF